jgi:hypothetical protein
MAFNSEYERHVYYAHDLLQAADTVMVQIDEDGIEFASKDFYMLVKDVAKEYGVSRRDLTNKIKELME